MTAQAGIFALGNPEHCYLELDLAAEHGAADLVRAVAALSGPLSTTGGMNLCPAGMGAGPCAVPTTSWCSWAGRRGVVWGLLAGRTSVRTALLIAAGLLAVGAGLARRVRLGYVSRLDPTPSTHWAMPEYADTLDPQAGPVLLTISYRVGAGQEEHFLEAMGAVSRSRRRTGAHRWELYRDPAELERFVESFTVPTWGEHARQHAGRLTITDRRVEVVAQSFLDEKPKVSHLLAADVPLSAPIPPA